MSKTQHGSGVRDRARTFTARQDTAYVAPPAQRLNGATRRQTRARRFVRRVVQRIAVLVALLILFYATSLHGVSARTFVLAAVLVLSLYWIFKGWL